MLQENKIMLRGTIVSMISGTKNISIRLATDGGRVFLKGPKHLREKNMETAYTTIIFHENLAEVSKFKVNDMVKIVGHIHGLQSKTGDNTKYLLQIIGDGITYTERLLYKYNKKHKAIQMIDKYKGGFPDDENLVNIIGQLHKKKQFYDDVIAIDIIATTNKGSHHCPATCFAKQAGIVKGIKEGEWVGIIGKVTTGTRKDSNEYVQRITVQDIDKLEDYEDEDEAEDMPEEITEEAEKTDNQ